MNGRALGIGLAAVLFGVAFVTLRRADASVAPDLDQSRADDVFEDFITSQIIFPAEEMTMKWFDELTNGRGRPYAAMFATAEHANALPRYMLARLAWQESHYRADIISGQLKSSAGALGIMQIVPRWHPGVDPLDPGAAINYAGGYLRKLYRQFGSWKLALMAYNWGPGNVAKWLKAGGNVPTETANYHSQILADLRQANPATVLA